MITNILCKCGENPRRKRRDKQGGWWYDCEDCHRAYLYRYNANGGRGMKRQEELVASLRAMDIIQEAFKWSAAVS